MAELEGPDASAAYEALRELVCLAAGFQLATPVAVPRSTPVTRSDEDGWVTGLIALGGTGLLGNDEVCVLDITYARDGVKYRLQHTSPTVRWLVAATQVQPIPDGKTCRYHADTGDVQLER